MVSKAVKKYGYDCSISWLIYGIGLPQHINKFDEQTNHEISSFLWSSNDTVVIEVFDNSMYPAFSKGDLVGGIWQVIDSNIDQKDKYIVNIDETIQLRLIRPSHEAKNYDLYSLNEAQDLKYPIQNNRR